MTTPRFHPAARLEYIEALLYLEGQRPGYGSRFETEVAEALARIREFPDSGAFLANAPSHVSARVFPLRSFRYSLVVVNEDDEAVVYAVTHQHRKPGYWQNRLP